MGDFSLGSVTPFLVQDWEGFDYPETAKVSPLLAAVAGSVGNALIQSPSYGYREATITGTIVSSSHLSTLAGYYTAKSAQTFTDDTGATFTVRVFEFTHHRVNLQSTTVWTFKMRLVEG